MKTELSIRGPVGDLSKATKAGNFPEDVKLVKDIFVKLGLATLGQDETATPALTDAIRKFQALYAKTQDGRLDPGGDGFQKLKRLAEGKAIIVNLRRQVLGAYQNLTRAHFFDCTCGDSQNPTPPGYYAIQAGRKHKKYRSKTYDAQMDYAMFFHGGYAIHMAYMVGVTSHLKTMGLNYFGSHGCVRLAESNASTLFDWTPEGTPVVIWPGN